MLVDQPDPALLLKSDRVENQPVTGHPSSKKIIDHDVRVLILGMGRVVARSRRRSAGRARRRQDRAMASLGTFTGGGRGGTRTAARPGSKAGPVILGGVEPVQQPAVPGRRHPHRLLGVGFAEFIGIAAELPAAFAHAPPGPLAVVQMLCFVGKIVGLAGAEMPRPGRQVELTNPPPLGGTDKTPSPPTARTGRPHLL